jgi:hypothetical protein
MNSRQDNATPSENRKEQAMSLVTTDRDSFDRHAAEAAMAWHGWGSPVGLAIALVGLGIAAVLIRFAVLGL